MALNLISPRYVAPDVTSAAIAGENIASSQAKTNLAKLSFAEQQRRARVQEGQAERQLAVNLASQMQSMAQKADMHPLQIVQMQKNIQAQSLQNQLSAQQLAENESSFEVDQLTALANLNGKEISNQIQKKNLLDKMQQDNEVPTLQAALNAIRSYANDPKNSDISTLSKVTSAGLSGKNLETFNSAIDQASKVILNRRDQDAESIAYNLEQQTLAVLMQSGALSPANKNNPQAVANAKQVYTQKKFENILSEFNSPQVPVAGSPKAMKMMAEHTEPNGMLNEASLRQALAADAGFTKTGMSVDDATGASKTTYDRRQYFNTGRKPMSQKEYIEAVQEVRAASAGLDGQPTLTVDEAKKQVDAMINSSVTQTGSGKSISNDFIHDLAQMMFASSKADDGFLDSDVGVYTDEATGREYLGKQGFGPSPDADNKMTEYREKLDKSGVNWSPVAGRPGTPKPDTVYWAWKKNPSGGIDMYAWLYKFDEKGNPVRTRGGGFDVTNILMKSGQMDGNIF